MAILVTGSAQHQSAADDDYKTFFRYTDNRAPNGATLTRVTMNFHAHDGSEGCKVKRFTRNTDGTFNARDIETFDVPPNSELDSSSGIPITVECNDLVPGTGDHYYGIYIPTPVEAPLDMISSDAENYCLTEEALGNSVDMGTPVLQDYQIECRFELALEPQPISNCTGRVGTIIDKVVVRANDYKMDMAVPAEIISWINEAIGEIAKRGYWKKTTSLPLTAGVTSYDLLTLVPDVEGITEIRQMINGYNRVYTPCMTRSEFEDRVRAVQGYMTTAAMADRWFVTEDNTLEIYPAPSASDALYIDHTYCPDDLDCLASTTPRIPKAHDALFVHFSLAQLANKDHGKPDWKDLYQLHRSKFEDGMFDLLAQSVWGDLSVRPSR